MNEMKRPRKHTWLTSYLSGLAFVIVTTGCYYDKEELLYPGSLICDTASIVRYSTTVLPIISNSCYSCHSGAFPSGAIKLDSYADLRVRALNGSLYGTITHNGSYPAMPRSAPKLSDCNIGYIKKWIDAGAPNN